MHELEKIKDITQWTGDSDSEYYLTLELWALELTSFCGHWTLRVFHRPTGSIVELIDLNLTTAMDMALPAITALSDLVEQL